MFGMLESITRAAIGIVKLPLDVVADVATLGGSLSEADKPYTVTAVEDIMQNLENATKPNA